VDECCANRIKNAGAVLRNEKKYLTPTAKANLPGVSLLEGGDKIWKALKSNTVKWRDKKKEKLNNAARIATVVVENVSYVAGFTYDYKKGTFTSNMNAWQRHFGYFDAYDKAAPFSLCDLDCEPITFEYDKRDWKIELWKGRYVLSTGCE
jgi:hypothetical protein